MARGAALGLSFYWLHNVQAIAQPLACLPKPLKNRVPSLDDTRRWPLPARAQRASKYSSGRSGRFCGMVNRGTVRLLWSWPSNILTPGQRKPGMTHARHCAGSCAPRGRRKSDGRTVRRWTVRTFNAQPSTLNFQLPVLIHSLTLVATGQTSQRVGVNALHQQTWSAQKIHSSTLAATGAAESPLAQTRGHKD